ncbi:MAG TPA: hypothetical protein VKT53_14200 [Candidatus Acidoferrum sp.]|nr:hypothetical protein [Candidatus Acidoferrum sp.]
MKLQTGRMIIFFLAGATLALSACDAIQAQNAGGGAASGASSASSKPGRDTSPTNAENSLELLPHPADKKEEKAFAAFRAVPAADAAKKVQAGETFLKSYPKSAMAQFVYPFLVVGYIQLGQVDKGVAIGQQDLAAYPQDYRTMAVLSQTLARTYNPSAPNAADTLAKANDYGKKAIEGIATLKKPEGATDESFTQMKAETEGMARCGVGLVLLRQDKFAEAIPELEKATTLNPNDQANFYLLGMAQANANRYADAAAAFGKCAALPGSLHDICTSSAADAKKNGTH